MRSIVRGGGLALVLVGFVATLWTFLQILFFCRKVSKVAQENLKATRPPLDI